MKHIMVIFFVAMDKNFIPFKQACQSCKGKSIALLSFPRFCCHVLC